MARCRESHIGQYCMLLAIVKLAQAAHTPPANSYISGTPLSRYIHSSVLPLDKVSFGMECRYRVIGEVATMSKVQKGPFREALELAFAKLNAIPGLIVKLSFEPASEAASNAEDPCRYEEDRDTCFARSFGQANSYQAVDVIAKTGVTRTSSFPQIGKKEFTYNKMVEAILREKGYEVRVVTLSLAVLPEGLHVFKHIPLTPLYSEETMLQLVGVDLPFSLVKQNLLLAVLDGLHLSYEAGVGYVSISQISERWETVPDSQMGIAGVANITLVTIRDQPYANMGEVLSRMLPAVLTRLEEVGQPRLTATVKYSRPISGHSVHDQMHALLPENERVFTFDSRVPFSELPSYPPPERSMLQSWTTAAPLALAMLCIGAGMWMFLRWSGNANVSINAKDGVPHNAAAAEGRLTSSLASSVRRNPWSPLFQLGADESVGNASFQTVGGDFSHLGDSATETAGLAGMPEKKRRLKLQKELWLASNIQGWEIDPASVEICKREDGSDHLLGSGSYGQVYKGTRGGVQDVAIKMLNYSDDLQLQQFCLEIQLLKSLSFDRNIVQFYGACLHDEHPMLVLELMEGGDLRNALSGPFREDMRWYRNGQHLALDIVRGIYFLHQNRVLHGDLKSRNILLSRGGVTAKIADVGMASVIQTAVTSQSFLPAAPGTFSHAAPELLLGQRCTEKADIFSIGVTLWELITQEIPVRGRLRSVRVPEECPQAISDVIACCLKSEPGERPSAKEVFEIIKAAQLPPPAMPRRESQNTPATLRNRISETLRGS